jgi:hypothetical protein
LGLTPAALVVRVALADALLLVTRVRFVPFARGDAVVSRLDAELTAASTNNAAFTTAAGNFAAATSNGLGADQKRHGDQGNDHHHSMSPLKCSHGFLLGKNASTACAWCMPRARDD